MRIKRRITGKNKNQKKQWEKLRERGVYSIDSIGAGLVGNNTSTETTK